jgi:hypothetical protein
MLKADWITPDPLRLSMMAAVQPYPSVVAGAITAAGFCLNHGAYANPAKCDKNTGDTLPLGKQCNHLKLLF